MNGRSLWKPLGSSWRDWDSDEFGPLRKNADDASAFIDGCIPHWAKGTSMRKNNNIAHQFNFAYYRMKRHSTHPERKKVGDPALPPQNVVGPMRSGKNNQFQFWRDLRPPFSIIEVRRVADEPHAGAHPDGDLHEVVYECGIDYTCERLWNTKSVSGTFDNRVHSTAQVRIPDCFPKERPISILSWGEPKLNWSPADDSDNDGNLLRPLTIDPSKWMPIADELQQRADLPRFAGCRAATKRADSRRGIQVKPLQKLLLGPHTSLAKLAACDQTLTNASPAAMEAAAMKHLEETGTFPPKKIRPRQHCIFTAAAGFVKYAG